MSLRSLCQRCGQHGSSWNIHQAQFSVGTVKDWKVQLCEDCTARVEAALVNALQPAKEQPYMSLGSPKRCPMESDQIPPATAEQDQQARQLMVACMDCGLPYADFPLDTTLPDEQWRMIHNSEGGLLCASCIVKRASRLPGVIAVRAIIEFAGGSVPNTRIRHSAESTGSVPPGLPTGNSAAPSPELRALLKWIDNNFTIPSMWTGEERFNRNGAYINAHDLKRELQAALDRLEGK